jgi:hypothetical protein
MPQQICRDGGAGWAWHIRWDGELDGTLARGLCPSGRRRRGSGKDGRCLRSGMGTGEGSYVRRARVGPASGRPSTRNTLYYLIIIEKIVNCLFYDVLLTVIVGSIRLLPEII